MNIIGLVGKAGSGKSTVASYIKELTAKTKIISLADPMKEFCKEIFDFSNDELWGDSKHRSAKNWRVKPDGKNLTPRDALQRLGTEFGRELYPDVWIDYALARAREALEGSRVLPAGSRSSTNSYVLDLCNTVVIPDVRFINEMSRILEEGGVVWRVLGVSTSRDKHPSETEQDLPEVDEYIDLDIPYTENPLHRKSFLTGCLANLGRTDMPYKSDAQRRKFHAMLAKGEISESVVNEYDSASKGKKLPDKVAKKKGKRSPKRK